MSGMVDTIRAVVREELSRYRLPEIGLVTEVFSKEDDSGPNNHQVSLKLRGSGVELKRAPVTVPRPGLSALPRVGDLVAVAFENGDLNAPIVLGSLYGSEVHPPKAGPLEVVYQPLDEEDSSIRRVHIELPGGNLITFDDEKLTVTCGATEMIIQKDGDITIKSDAKVSFEAKGDMVVAAQGALKIESQQDVTIKGINVTMEGQAGAKVKGPQISLAGVTNFSPS